MIEIRATNLTKSMEALKLKRKKVEDTADAIFRRKAMALFAVAVRVTPQFSGDWASNWHLVVDEGGKKSYKMWPRKADMQPAYMRADASSAQREAVGRLGARFAGHPEAVNFALTRAQFTKGITRKSKIWFYNPTNLSTDGTSVTGPDGTKALRPYNVIDGGTRLESYLRAKAKDMK